MPNEPRKNVVYMKERQITRSNTTATELFTLPAEAIPTMIVVFTSAAAVGGTIDIGISGSSTLYVNGDSVATAGTNFLTLLNRTKRTAPTVVYASIGGAPGAGGPFSVCMFFTYGITSGKVV